MKKLERLSVRVRRIARKISRRQENRQERRERKGDFSRMTRPMRRKSTPVNVRVTPIVAYDFETTKIAKGTPHPLYLTACGENSFWFSGEILSLHHLSEVLSVRFLTDEMSGVRFVAWNGNRYDVYFIALALLKNPDYILRPYLTRSKNLRGLRVIRREYSEGVETTFKKGAKIKSWEFLDGMAMTGVSRPLADFLKVFAPSFLKLNSPDWENETFNPRNRNHVDYAERDSEGLFNALQKIRSILIDKFSIDLSGTVGNMGIKIFQRYIPDGVECWKPPVPVVRVIRDSVMRGGFCFCVRRYAGPVWKYDINQAYAAAMRESDLPAGRCMNTDRIPKYSTVFIARISAVNFKNRIPFYYRDSSSGRSVFGLQEIGDTWLTSIEYFQLEKEGWKIQVLDVWFWESKFRMKKYVDTLEFLRVGEGRNPKDAQGEIVKAIGNNSYGKTVEQLDGLELVMAAEQPEGFSSYQEENEDLKYIWFKFAEPMMREYHQPQIGAFITAHVRMVVRRAALLSPDTWLYADTDCVMFSAPVVLDCDPFRYGAWKIEAENELYKIITKKVYISGDGKTKHAKGLNIRFLNQSDFDKWLSGVAPVQKQLQRQNFVKVMSGFEMFIEREKVGEIIDTNSEEIAA